MTDNRVAASEAGLAKMADMISGLPEIERDRALFKANSLVQQAANITLLPDGARQEVAAEWLAAETDVELRKAAADAVGLTLEAPSAEADGGDAEPTDEEVEAWLGTLSDEEIEALQAEIEAEGQDELPEEFYDVVAEMSDEEIEAARTYVEEAQKLDEAAEGASLNKADAMASAWLNRGDEELKKFIGAAMASMKAAGAFSRAVGARAGAAVGSRAGAAVGRARGGKTPGVKFGNAMMGARKGAVIGRKIGRKAPSAAIGTGVLGGGGALFSSRKNK